MNERVKRIFEQAQALPPDELEELVEDLLANLGKTNPQADQAWREAIDERLAELDMGDVETFDFDKAIAELRGK